ncbi:TRAFAC clade GTPase domain-containing protein [Isoptericola aurantiacus]|uniref:TRAFAC clade GTPase domain-containing protein n=1 Tax=Isoptericola aurantiacus TaxID=3377839 RepID=UPI00383AF8E5
MAASLRVRDQHIAVFGGSGSGKTVLVSSFYGATQEPAFTKEGLFHVIADDTGQGHRLRQIYLGMKNDAKTPAANRFAAVPYSFTIKLKDPGDAKAAKSRPFDALRLVWHDYPGEWFEQEPSSETEATRRVDTFRSLLRSDVAMVLVDGQKLLDYAGDEEKYLKSLFGDLRDGLLRLKDELLDDGERLKEFPRVWIIALSKADLHPELHAHGFQDLLIQKAAGDVAALRDVITDLVQFPEALSLGEDFLLLSSAKFEPERIEVTKRVGLDLILPVASILPLQRLVQWSQHFEVPRRLLDHFADNAEAIALVLVTAKSFRDVIGKIPKVGPLLASALPMLAQAAQLSRSRIEAVNATARAKHDNLAAVLSQFQLDLERGEEDGTFVKSNK